jgi:CheY-like chemotaxis protein
LEGLRVLVVEDGATNRKLLGLLLGRAGAEVAMAENGRQGADLALSEPFDLVLMDMQMPVMDGYTAATLLRQRGLTLPIIAMTAHAMKGDREKCLAAGCSGYVSKPIDADLLIRTLAETSAGDSRNGQAALVDRPRSGGSEAEGETIFSTLPTEDPAFREVVEEFIQRLKSGLDSMRQAMENRDLPELARLAHWLKGAGGTAGFAALTDPAKRLETLVRDEQCDQIEAALADLAELSRRLAVAPAEPPPVPAS